MTKIDELMALADKYWASVEAGTAERHVLQRALENALKSPMIEPAESEKTMTVVYRDVTKEDVESFMKHPKSFWYGWCNAPYQRDHARWLLENPSTARTGEVTEERGGGLPWTVKCADGKTRLLYPDAPATTSDDLKRIIGECYQVIGTLAEECGRFDTLAVTKALDNAASQRIVHEDVLPFPGRMELCHCKDRLISECPGEWEPGCDLGNNEKYCKAAT